MPAPEAEGVIKAEPLQPESPRPEIFDLARVEKMAEALARQAFVKPKLAGALAALAESDWNGIRFKPDQQLWRADDLPFEVAFFHPGFIYANMASITLIEDEGLRPLAFSSSNFTYPNAELAQKAGGERLDYAGLKVTYPLNEIDKKDEVLSFLGATHFRALAKRSLYGLDAMALIVNPANAEGEEQPCFRRFWLKKPQPEESLLTIYALMDSPDFTGAYQFDLSPGPSTVMEVKAVLFKRNGKNQAIKIGLAPMSSMYLFSEKENGRPGDWRPEVHNSDILLWTDGDNNWRRRPLSNPAKLEVNHFELNSPKGFGLMQQDGSFDHYQDFRARFDLRPSLWVEPSGDWGSGGLELMEIPSSQEIHNNIIAFWTPKEDPFRDGRLDLAYKLYWMPSGTVPHQLGRAVSTRLCVNADSGLHHFLIDFEGGLLNDIPEDSGLASLVTASSEIPIMEKSLVKNPLTGGWRLEFKLKNPENGGVVQSLISARGERRSLRLEARLKKGENLPESLTETWVYDLPY